MHESLAARGRCHTRLREVLAEDAPTLDASEREVLLDAADALLFDEPEGRAKREAAHALVTALVQSDRLPAESAGEVRAALDGCGIREPAASR